jgi:hypothetical protein
MMKKIFLSVFLILALAITTLFIFDFQKRFLIIRGIIPVYNIYKQLEVRTNLRTRNFSEIEKNLKLQIELSKKYGSTKTGFTNGIYDIFQIVYDNILFKDEYYYFENLSKEWSELHPDIYLAKIFYAKTLFEIYIKGEKKENFSDVKINEIKKILLEAIEISNSREEAYRIGIEFSNLIKSKTDLNIFCNKYYISSYGGIKPRSHNSIFGGFGDYSIDNLAFYINDDINNLMLGDNLTLNKKLYYDFNFYKKENIHKFNLIFSTLPGILMEIESIIFNSGTEKKIEISIDDIFVTSKRAYNIESKKNNLNLILTSKDNDEIVTFHFKENYSEIENISILMNFRRANISNLNNNSSLRCNY